MFTAEQIKQAHSKVKSGADFPAYIQEIKQLGVTCYQTHVADGHTDYFGAGNYQTTSPAKYAPLTVANTCNSELFKSELKIHQQGQSDYPAFIEACARLGVEKWSVCMQQMTCAYYDKAGTKILIEAIPQS